MFNKLMVGTLILFPIMANASHDPYVFKGQHPFRVRVNHELQTVDVGQSERTYDFGLTGSLVSKQTGKGNAATLIAALPHGKNVVLSGAKIKPWGVPGRIEPTRKGLKIAIKEGDGRSDAPLRTTIASFALPTDQRLAWNLRIQFGDASEAGRWELTPSGSDPALIWQIKAPGLQPSLAMIVDTDDEDPTRLMLFFNIKTGPNAEVQRAGTVRGLRPYQPIAVSMQAVLDEEKLTYGGRGFWRVKVNNRVAVNYKGPTLMAAATEPHQWYIGLYRYLTNGPAEIPRLTYWSRAQLLALE